MDQGLLKEALLFSHSSLCPGLWQAELGLQRIRPKLAGVLFSLDKCRWCTSYICCSHSYIYIYIYIYMCVCVHVVQHNENDNKCLKRDRFAVIYFFACNNTVYFKMVSFHGINFYLYTILIYVRNLYLCLQRMETLRMTLWSHTLHA
jgi:hypothetical protein